MLTTSAEQRKAFALLSHCNSWQHTRNTASATMKLPQESRGLLHSRREAHPAHAPCAHPTQAWLTKRSSRGSPSATLSLPEPPPGWWITSSTTLPTCGGANSCKTGGTQSTGFNQQPLRSLTGGSAALSKPLQLNSPGAGTKRNNPVLFWGCSAPTGHRLGSGHG